ncbi:uncharacterized protein LOC18435571 isoform X2 [Amborella trichopoda]|uniref:uncharacterized protein LOC18435571 isoform X2 n=1 Tax=Amborella trichopoda TaxID=13333 RepID=UPI0009BEC04A|nr:uncharacterized protein LOC18435571 isoform X2 [Amborella trichopoda]|eukprot:XP_020523688.1 uncharacterized protein LOC18435571 isoform X2 [Amborella trichopoda]
MGSNGFLSCITCIRMGSCLSLMFMYVIIYEQPVCGLHHFSLNSWASSYEHLCASPSGQISHKKPRWIDELDQKQPFCNLNTVIAALNCSHAAKTIFWRNVIPQTRSVHVIAVSMMVASIWQIVAMTIASASTLYYVLLQCSNRFLNHCFPSLLHWMLNMLLDHTWKIVHIRSCQLLYWPIVLLGSSFRAQSCVEYVHRASLIRHSVWSSIIVDVLLGNVVGFILLGHVEEICFWVSHLVRDITNGLLRSGCVWLMGVPAGFKLNTELAEVIGMIALNAIQIWSTLWFFMNSFFAYFVKVLAISGILFGVTVPASLCIDLLSLSTLHIWALHWLISLIYSLQIQALASVWRLFRGRKWNPLRQRLDSYNYSVEQHVVGSLLFTPLLLLLPTTSVFYIFFTILYRTVSSIHFLMELAISFLHAAPYAEIFLWVVWPRMFPSGIWFKILSEHSESCRQSPKGNGRNDFIESSQDLGISRRMTTVVSILGSNSATIGQVLHPHSRKVFSGVSMSSVVSSAYGVFSGRRIPSALHAKLPLTLPWMSIGIREFWWLCCDSIRTRMRKF